MRAAPFVEELTPAPSPWEIAQAFSTWPHLLFLDSSEQHPQLGRYSFIAADPIEWFCEQRVEFGADDPLATLDKELRRRPAATIPGLPLFQGGLAGLFGFGMGHAIERFPRAALDDFQVPDLAVGLYDWVIAFDHLQKRAWLVAHSERSKQDVKKQLAAPRVEPTASVATGAFEDLAPQFPLPGYAGVTTNFSRPLYLDVARRAIEYVHAGDCFQVNIAQRLLSPCREAPLALYGRLRQRNPAPFSGFLDLGEFAVASASPERFLRVERREVESRPIKGTRPRGDSPAVDRANAAELAAAAKDRAENVMIVDLVRNDLGRACEFGSVRVPRVCQVESYRFVHHLVSVVTGKLRAECSPFDLLRSAFPGGSVTGAPKVRALEIISELEPTERGPYCGSLAYIGFDGAMDANILIRTFTIGKGWAQFPVGGGIVADSEPEREYEETLHKAAGMLTALRSV
jgi:para-aminobenzoate synthetase component I